MSASWAKWYVGQRVWCKETPTHDCLFGFETLPQEGTIYTIRNIKPGIEEEDIAWGPYAFLVEIVNPSLPYEDKSGELSFSLPNYFEPVKEETLDVFRDIAAKATKMIKERV